MAGSNTADANGGGTYVCLTKKPELAQFSVLDQAGVNVYHVEYSDNGAAISFPTAAIVHHDALCTVCQVSLLHILVVKHGAGQRGASCLYHLTHRAPCARRRGARGG